MADVHSTEIRSYNMSRIKGKNTKPEMLVRKFLFANGFRYRLNLKNLPGKPDFVLPKTRTEWWLKKITDTQIRDRKSELELKKLAWKVIVIWECELRNKLLEQTLLLINNSIT